MADAAGNTAHEAMEIKPPPEMKATQEEMKAAKIALAHRYALKAWGGREGGRESTTSSRSGHV